MNGQTKLFETGQTVATRGVVAEMDINDDFKKHVAECMAKHIRGEWGDLDASDAKQNDDAVKNKDARIFSAYAPNYQQTGLKKIWIITEWDRSVTTILFPDEY